MGSTLVGDLPHTVAGERTDSGAHRLERDGSMADSQFTAASPQQLYKHE